LDPKNIYAYNNLGTACYKKGDYEEAIKAFDKAIQLNSKLCDLYYNRGLTYYKKGEYKLAIEDFGQVIKLNQYFDAAYYYRANAYEKLGKSKEEGDDCREIRWIQWGRNKWFQEKLAKLKKGTQRRALTQLLDAVLVVQKKLRFKFDKSQNTTIAHYTSRDILQGYFEKANGRFRLYSSDSMNDPTEGREIFRIMNEDWSTNLEKELYFEEASKDHEVTYIGSFVSGERCEDKLLFWRTYGEDALGCSLSFGEEALSKNEYSASVCESQSSVPSAKPQPPTYMLKSRFNEPDEHPVAPPSHSSRQRSAESQATYGSYAFHKVTYGEGEVSDMLREQKTQIKHLLEESNNDQKKIIREILRGILNEVRFLVKSHYYEDEQEARIVFVQKYNNPKVKIHTDKNKDNCWRSYIELNEKFHPGKIMMGPRVKDKQAIKIWFDNNQHTKIKGEDVHFSPAPYGSYS